MQKQFGCVVVTLLLACSLQAADSIPLISGNEIQITDQDMDIVLLSGPLKARHDLFNSSEKVVGLIENSYLKRVLANEAREMGLADDPETQRKLQRIIDNFLADVRLNALKKEPIPDLEALAELQYKAYQERYQLPETVHISHILISTRKHNDEEAKQLADEARQKALEGDDFAQLAAQYSEDPSVTKNQGDLGTLVRRQMVAPFGQAAFALDTVGQISEPVLTKFGYHVIKLHQKTPAKQLSFEEVKADLVKQVEQQYRKDHQANYFSELKQKTGMQFHGEAIQAYINERLQQATAEMEAPKKEIVVPFDPELGFPKPQPISSP